MKTYIILSTKSVFFGQEILINLTGLTGFGSEHIAFAALLRLAWL